MQNVWFMAAAWMGLAFVASVISIRIGVSVALLEIGAGIIAGNFFGFHPNEWINFLVTFGAGLLIFLAGAEIDPDSLYAHWRASLTIGVISFLVPFLGSWAFAHWVAGWDYHGSLIAGMALSTTSVAVVYAVMVEGSARPISVNSFWQPVSPPTSARCSRWAPSSPTSQVDAGIHRRAGGHALVSPNLDKDHHQVFRRKSSERA